MPVRARSIRLRFTNPYPAAPQLIAQTSCLATAPPSHDRGDRTGVTGYWVQLEDKCAKVVYRRDIPAMMRPLTVPPCSDARPCRDTRAGEFAQFDVLVPCYDDAVAVVLFAPPPDHEGTPRRLGEASVPIGRYPFSEGQSVQVPPRTARKFPVDICGKGRGNILGVSNYKYQGRIVDVDNVIILADKFSSASQDKFTEKVASIIDFLFARPPFSSTYGGAAMNVFLVNVETGSSYFNVSYNTSPQVSTLVTWDYTCVTTVCDTLFSSEGMPYWTYAAILINEDFTKLGTAYGNQFGMSTMEHCSLETHAEYVFQHELGHAIFSLCDEYTETGGTYAMSEPAGANLTIVRDQAMLKWARFVTAGVPIPTLDNPSDCSVVDTRPNPCADSDVGLYAGGTLGEDSYSCGLFHPQYRCVMNKEWEVDGIFCPVCLNQARLHVAGLASLPIPVRGSLSYSPASGVWKHTAVAARNIRDLGYLEDYSDFDALVEELRKGSVEAETRLAFQKIGQWAMPLHLTVYCCAWDASRSHGAWILISVTVPVTYFVYTMKTEDFTYIRLGTVVLPDLPSLPPFDGAIVGTKINLFGADDGALLFGRCDLYGEIEEDEMQPQTVVGLEDRVASVSAALLDRQVWVSVADDDDVKIAAYELPSGHWWDKGFIVLRTAEPVEFSFVRSVKAGISIHVLALAGSAAIMYGAFQTPSRTWIGEAVATPLTSGAMFFDVAVHGNALHVIVYADSKAFLYSYSLDTKQWSDSTDITAKLGLGEQRVMTALALAVLGDTLHVVALVDRGAEHAMYDLTHKTWKQPLTVIAPVPSLAADTRSLTLLATESQLYLELSKNA